MGNGRLLTQQPHWSADFMAVSQQDTEEDLNIYTLLILCHFKGNPLHPLLESNVEINTFVPGNHRINSQNK